MQCFWEVVTLFRSNSKRNLWIENSRSDNIRTRCLCLRCLFVSGISWESGTKCEELVPSFRTRDKEQRGSPIKEGRGGSLVPYWSSDNAPNHFLLRLPIKGHALCEQRKLRCFHRPVWLFDFAEENCPSTGTGKNKFNKYCRHLWFFMFLLVWILVLHVKCTDWDIRLSGFGIYEKGTFSGRDLIPGSYLSLCFIPPSPRYTLVLYECVTCLGKRDPLAPAPKKDHQKNITPGVHPNRVLILIVKQHGVFLVFLLQ